MKRTRKGNDSALRRLYTLLPGRSFVLPDDPGTVGEVRHVPEDESPVTVFFMTVGSQSKYEKGSEYTVDRKTFVDVTSDRIVGALAVASTWRPQRIGEVVQTKVVEADDYPGTPKQLPPIGKLDCMWVASNGTPYKPRSTKWKDVRRWAEQTVEHYRDEHQQALRLTALVLLARGLECSLEDENKIVRRLKAIYPLDWARDKRDDEIMFAARGRTSLRPQSPQTKGEKSPRRDAGADEGTRQRRSKAKGGACDAWGTRLGTRTANINAAITSQWQTVKEIEATAGCHGASSHVGKLVKLGKVIREGRKYKLAKGEEGCQPSSRSEKSDDTLSTSRKEGSRSDKRAKPSRQERSTGKSRKGKRGKSGRRRSSED